MRNMRGLVLAVIAVILVSSLKASDIHDAAESPELMQYLKEIKFDAERHRQLMRMEISANTCPQLTQNVGSFNTKAE
jgi:hypothetical protein